MRAWWGLGLGLAMACGADDGRDRGSTGPFTPTPTSGGVTSGVGGSTETDDGLGTFGDPGTGGPSTTGTPPSTTTGASTSADESTGGSGQPSCPAPGAPLDCSPGPGSGEADTCVDDPSCFLELVQASVLGVVADYPEWFDQSSGQPYVLDVEAYMNAVVERVGQSECSIRDPNAGDEIVVKHDNAFAENFDILTAQGFVRYGDGIYTSKCIPAWF